MPKRKSPDAKPDPAAQPRRAPSVEPKPRGKQPASPAEPARRLMPSAAAVRETVHFVVEILVLVFLIITFEVQAFVIPTGSLAPTLLGRHKEVTCPACGYAYQVSAAGEVDSSTGASYGPGRQVVSCSCPMCRYTADLGPNNPQKEDYPSFAGERVVVSKFAYQFGQPRRWDIAPFKYPGGAAMNYIKRIVGLPEETVRIYRGDVLTRPGDEAEFEMARKPPKTVAAMAQPVYDNDYVLPKIIEQGWPARWNPDTPGDWVRSQDCRSFETDGTKAGEAWLRYRHFVHSHEAWQALESGRRPADPKPQLIADFSAYNSGRCRDDVPLGQRPGLESVGLHWVGDLMLQCTMEVQSDSGEAIFELVEGGRRMQCRIDVATGTATLTIDGLDPDGHPARTSAGQPYELTATTDVRGPGVYRIRWANFDDQLFLWVGGKWLWGGPVEFDAPTKYAPLNNGRPQPADLSPVGIGSRGAAFQVSRIQVSRDVYYIADRGGPGGLLTDFDHLALPFYPSPEGVADFLCDPQKWDALAEIQPEDFPLEADQFLALGDNSSHSLDSRLWPGKGFEHYVSRRLLLGKALLVIWPHSPVTIPGTGVPCFPNLPGFRAVR